MKFSFQSRTLIASVALLCGCAVVRDARLAQSDAREISSRTLAGPRPAPRLAGASLKELADFALTNRPSVASAALELEDARLALVEIAADAPLASATPWNAVHARATLGYSESSKPAHAEDFRLETRRGDLSGAFSFDLLVWDFGRNDARARAQSERVVAAEQALWREGWTVFGEVASSYFALLGCEALREVAETNVAQYAGHLERAEDRFEQGEAHGLDVLRAKLDLARAAESAVAASNDVEVAGARLMAALGLEAPAGGFREVVGDRGDALGSLVRAFPDSSATAAETFAFASTNAPAMRIARANVEAASAQVDCAVADLYPSVSAGVSFSWTDPSWIWRWGLDAAQTLLDGSRRSAAVARATASLGIAAKTLEETSQKLSASIETAVAERDSAREGLAAAETSVRQAKENLDTVAAQYDVGDVSRVDFTDAVSAYADALASRVKAFCRGQAAEAALFELAGMKPVYATEGK